VNRLPVLLSIPHSGTWVPEEVESRVCLTRSDLFDDTDAFSREIYDLDSRVVEVVGTEIARAFIDLNRAPNDLPPKNPDGVVKTLTCYEKPIYHQGRELDSKLTVTLLRRYYHPYHLRIREVVRRPGVTLALDCHSMASEGPAISPDTGLKRPMVCLGNRNGRSCDRETTEKLADCFRKAFALTVRQVRINYPFAGGFITRTYGNKPLPWIQVEINRALYLVPPWFDRDTLEMDSERLRELNYMFETALRMFFSPAG